MFYASSQMPTYSSVLLLKIIDIICHDLNKPFQRWFFLLSYWHTHNQAHNSRTSCPTVKASLMMSPCTINCYLDNIIQQYNFPCAASLLTPSLIFRAKTNHEQCLSIHSYYVSYYSKINDEKGDISAFPVTSCHIHLASFTVTHTK